MNDFTFKVSGLNCDSCERLLQKALQDYVNAQLKYIDFQNGHITISCEEKDLDSIKKSFVEKGFGVEGVNFISKSRFKTFFEGITGSDPKFATEKNIIFGSLISLVILLLTLTIFYFVFLVNTTQAKLLPILILTIFGVVVNYGAMKHIRIYNSLSCSTGMMTGMTIGMMSGFMLGAILGATNGMFVGSLLGMIVGMMTGILAGKPCGIMGILEGMMAGLMAGLMGAMTSFMLITDHLIPFMFILFTACSTILAGLSYLLYKEVGNLPEQKISFANIFITCFIISVIVVLIILLGPKSQLAWGFVS